MPPQAEPAPSLPSQLIGALYTSRPGLWPTQLWFYLLPLGGRRLLDEGTFWLGAVYVMFPLSHVLYGWNDLADYQTDQLNPRKGNLLFGARMSQEELARLPRQLLLVQAPFLLLLGWAIGPKLLAWVAAGVAVNYAYNGKRWNLKGRPGWDLLCQSGYLLVFVLSSWLNDVPMLPWPAMVFGALFAMHAHLFHEVTDIEPDALAGRRTTAVAIGVRWSKLIVAALLLTECVIVAAYFQSAVVAGFLAAAGVSFAADALLRPHRVISEKTLRAVFLTWNLVVLASMYWIWRDAIFAQSAVTPAN
ncbi:prenyltransferase [Posidoniimonas polymericola]|uniref:Prenyltransferase n=1 Tax=Posidoniimonas polymericola TaxID=2528002 RepID=A0A5C5YUA0_9BACT|nr:UbiA family prenyltransferase [Posidoniimonas polymericola]TWT78525.1 prenyltransferase [Posidoniimonas polymericola]